MKFTSCLRIILRRLRSSERTQSPNFAPSFPNFAPTTPCCAARSPATTFHLFGKAMSLDERSETEMQLTVDAANTALALLRAQQFDPVWCAVGLAHLSVSIAGDDEIA